MAYIVESSITETAPATATTFTLIMPPSGSYATNDLIVGILHNLSGGTTISQSGGSDWTVEAGQAQSTNVRMAIVWKVAASGAEANPVFTGTNAPWNGTAFAVKGAPTSSPVSASARANMSAARSLASGALSTGTDANCLLIYAFGTNGGGQSRFKSDEATAINTSITLPNSNVQVIGYRQMGAAGSAPTVTGYTAGSVNGQLWALAIKNNTGAALQSWAKSGLTELAWYGANGSPAGAITQQTADNFGATINGITVSAGAVTLANSVADTLNWGQASSFSSSENFASPPTAKWVGFYHTLTFPDMTGKIFSVEWLSGNSSTAAQFGADGLILAFRDAAGNHVAYQLAPKGGWVVSVPVRSAFEIGVTTPYASSGSIDWTAVTGVGYFAHRVAATAAATGLTVKNAVLFGTAAVVGGGAASPSSYRAAWKALTSCGLYLISTLQGTAQVFSTASVQIGDGSIPTYFDASAQAFEFPAPYNAVTQKLWNVSANVLQLSAYAAGGDTISLTAGGDVTTQSALLTIDPSFNTSSTFSVAGRTFVGFLGAWKTGVPCSGATFKTCGIIAFAGADIVNATISGGTGTAALSASNGFSATGSALTASATCLYGIRIAAAGTFDLASTTFSGFTKDLDVTAATGTVTVNLAVGQATPTHQTAGATVTFVSSPVFQSVTVSGLAATARIQIYDATSSTQLYLGVPGTASHTWTDSSAAVGSRSIRLRIMRCVGTSADIIVDKLIGTCGTTEAAKAVSYLHDAVLDTAYNGNAFDGSTITGIAIIDGTMRLQISSGTIVAYGGVDTLVIDGRKAYAYETYWLSTDAGLVDESRFIIATDGVNLRFVDFKIKNTTSGPVYPVIVNNAYVVDDATGVSASLTDYTGGPIHYAPDHMISNVVTVGGVNIITGDIADVPARVQTGLTSQGYTTARATHLEEIAKIEGLSIADPVIIDNDAQTRVAGLISQTVIKVGNVTTIQRL